MATQDGELKLPPLRIVADQTITSFDRAYPQGADYVVVPAVTKRDDPALIAWLLAQAGKGATTSLPLKAICSRIGYADEHNLRRVFVRNFGVNPMQYRARFSERS